MQAPERPRRTHLSAARPDTTPMRAAASHGSADSAPADDSCWPRDAR
jgi:hypothetical protein